jgi:uncharacterized membrane protein
VPAQAGAALFWHVFRCGRIQGENMRSKVHVAGHPLHPILVALPIGAFTLALIADLASAFAGLVDGPTIARFAIGVGIVTALLAAVVGLVDYLALPLGEGARRTATLHLIVNVLAVGLYAASWLLRADPLRLGTGRTLSYLAFAILGLGGWFGGELVFKGRVGVDEQVASPPPRR